MPSRPDLPATRPAASEPSGAARRRRRRGGALLVMLVVAIVLAVIIGLVMIASIRSDQRASEQKYGEDLAAMSGLGRPIKNKLAAEFTDADGDLVADAPADSGKQIDPPEIVFSYVASERNTPELAATFKPFTDALSAKLGRPVRYLPITDIDAEQAAMKDGSLHLCALNTGAVPNAVDVVGFVPVALLGSDNGSAGYTVKIIASTRTNIGDINSLRGHELTLTEMSSNSGYKAPLVLLQQKFGLRPGFDYGIRYSLGHQESIEGLVNGTFDVIAVASDVLARAEAAGAISKGQYRVVYTSDAFPTACFGYVYNLKPELAKKISEALAGYQFGDDATGAYFKASGQTHLIKVDYKKDFGLIRDIDDAIGYEHKLHPVASEAPTTAPSTQP